jgi:FixJ family two-component response regulator
MLMTDVVRPEMNGRDLARTVHGIHVQIKLLFASGHTADVIAPHGVLDEGAAFIRKPFSGEDLAIKVRATLDRA